MDVDILGAGRRRVVPPLPVNDSVAEEQGWAQGGVLSLGIGTRKTPKGAIFPGWKKRTHVGQRPRENWQG